MTDNYLWNREGPSDPDVADLEQKLGRFRYRRPRRTWHLAAAAALLLAAAGTA